MSQNEIRLPLLLQLAEQAMGDEDFRRAARESLDDALRTYGYDLNDRELALVSQFRKTLEEAGVDLFLAKQLDLSAIDESTLRKLMDDFEK